MSSPLLARQGRHLQRYKNQLRLVAGCIPYKINGNSSNQSGDLMNRVEVLMISSPGRHDLIFPKGGWEKDETACEAACREALEEAGVRGIINGDELGHWVFRSKSRQGTCNLEGACKGYMYALEVTEELEYWPEQNIHGRKWVALPQAFQLCRYEWMREALRLFMNRLLPLSELPEPSNFCIEMPAPAKPAITIKLPLDSLVHSIHVSPFVGEAECWISSGH